ADKPAPTEPGGGGLRPLVAAPGTYVFDKLTRIDGMYTGIGHSLGTDYFRIADQLTGDELRYLRRARDLADSEVLDSEVLPVINGYWERAEFPWPLIQALIVGGTSPVPAPSPDSRTIRFVDIQADRVRLRT